MGGKHRMICYICGDIIGSKESFLCIGRDKKGNKLYRHDDKEHEDAVLEMFKVRTAQEKLRTSIQTAVVTRDNNLGEQIG